MLDNNTLSKKCIICNKYEKKVVLALIAILFILVSSLIVIMRRLNNYKDQVVIKNTAINLPQPSFKSKTSVEEALLKRRSVREFKKQPITLRVYNKRI